MVTPFLGECEFSIDRQLKVCGRLAKRGLLDACGDEHWASLGKHSLSSIRMIRAVPGHAL
jgi:hypothetical protein